MRQQQRRLAVRQKDRFSTRSLYSGDLPNGYSGVMKVAAILLCVIAIGAMTTVIGGMVVGVDSGRRGWLLRAVALLAFVLAVILNVAAG
jgi:hypothetical protein